LLNLVLFGRCPRVPKHHVLVLVWYQATEWLVSGGLTYAGSNLLLQGIQFFQTTALVLHQTLMLVCPATRNKRLSK